MDESEVEIDILSETSSSKDRKRQSMDPEHAAFLDPIEHQPSTILYRKPQNRPTIADIRRKVSGDTNEPQSFQKQEEIIYENSAEREQFPWFTGVFVPVFLNLVCVTFFIDLHRSIQTTGWFIGFLIFFLSLAMSYSTLISICVIATNGDMRDGGCYYLISRTLGPEIGGACGLTLVLAHTTAIAFRLSYAASIITNIYTPKTITSSERWDRTCLQMIFNTLIFGLTLFGIKTVMYLMVFLLVLLVVGVVCFYLGFIFRKPGSPSFFTGLSLETLRANFGSKRIGVWNVLTTFGLLFPSSNAIMTCANFSGNLNPPRRAIPLGGFTAMLLSSIMLMLAFVFEASSFDYTDVASDKYMGMRVSIAPVLSYIGFFASCIGSSLTMHTGGSRIIAAMCKDGLLPKVLAKWKVNNELVITHLIQLVISLLLSFVDSPDTATLITNVFFLLPFALVNWAVWTAASAHYPGFRPSFKFYSKYVALIFSIICFIRMFMIRWYIALACIGLFLVFFWIYKCKHLADNWGSVTQSKIFYKTLKEELNLYHIQPHPKTFRPNIILITTLHPDDRHPTIDFLNMLLHSNGMAAVGRVFITQDESSIDYLSLIEERDGTYLTTSERYKTFYDVTVAKTFSQGVTDLILMMGIGLMQPNTLCLVFPDDWNEEHFRDIPASEFIDSLDIAEEAVLNAMIVRHVKLFPEQKHEGTIDVWWDTRGSGFTLLLAHLLSQSKAWKNTKIRVIVIADLDAGADVDEQSLVVANLLYKFKLKAEILSLGCSNELDEPSPFINDKWQSIMREANIADKCSNENVKNVLLMADLIRSYSINAAAIFLLLPNRPVDVDKTVYMCELDLLSMTQRPFVLVKQNGERPFGFSV